MSLFCTFCAYNLNNQTSGLTLENSADILFAELVVILFKS